MGEEPAGKLILEKAAPFSQIPRELWIKFPNIEAYKEREQRLLRTLSQAEGSDSVGIYLEKERAKKILPPNWKVEITQELIDGLSEDFGKENIGISEKKLKGF